MTTMTHDEVGDLAAERYLLHEMTEEERDAFEEHYGDCVVCASEVQQVYAFRDSVRSTKLCQDSNVADVVEFRPRGWRRFTAPLFAAAASVLLTTGGMYQFAVRPMVAQLAEVRRPVTPASHVVSLTRAESGAAIIANRHEPFEFDVEIDVDDEKPAYSWTILDARGDVRYGPIHAGADHVRDLRLPVLIPGDALEPGNYTLRVLSKRALNIPFTVR